MISHAILGALALLAQDPDGDVDARYAACVAGVEAAPTAGFEAAARWEAFGGGAPAAHCLALAEIARGRPRAGAERLAALALDERGDPAVSARLYQQAADAFLAAGLEERAVEAIDEALVAVPRAAELHASAAKIYAAAGRWGRVASAVDAADAEGAAAPGLIVLRGRARQALGDIEGAFEDVAEALRRDPENVDALVLRGELLQATAAVAR